MDISGYNYELPTNMPLYESLQATDVGITGYDSSTSNVVCSNFYWLASRCWFDTGMHNFPMGRCNIIRFVGYKEEDWKTSVRGFYSTWTSLGGILHDWPTGCAVRPVVELTSNVKIVNDGIKDGKSENSAYILE